MSTEGAGTEMTGHEATGRKQFIVFLGRVKEEYETTPVKASAILEKGGATPVDQFVLEALVGESGKVDHEFKPDDDVHLDVPHRKHFRAVPSGGGRA